MISGKTLRIPLAIAGALIITAALSAQRQDSLRRLLDPETQSVYRTKKLISIGIIGAGALANTIGLERLRDKEPLNQATLNTLSEDDIPKIDRWGLRQNATNRQKGEDASDRVFQLSAILPFTLLIDKKFRKDWLDLSLIYVETQMIASNFYTYGPIGPTFVDRYRPMAYYSELDKFTRNSGNNRNSFFSGHVSSTATGTYTFAKFLSDYNPQWTGGQRALCFGLAAVPPAFVAVQRVRALKHFPTDTVVGLAVGAFFGTMVPHFHKRWAQKHRSRLSVGGAYGEGSGGAGLVLTF